jgi:hypothetical protein
MQRGLTQIFQKSKKKWMYFFNIDINLTILYFVKRTEYHTRDPLSIRELFKHKL